MREDLPACTSMPPPAGGLGREVRRWSEPEAEHIDVRGLAPPQPLVAIVRAIESLPRTRALIVHHDRDPVLLYPELAERGWFAEPIAAPEGEVRLRLVADAQS